MTKPHTFICATALLIALPTIALAAPNAVRLTDPSTNVSASVYVEAEDGVDIIASPASTYGTYVRADNAPVTGSSQVEFSFNLKPNDGDYERNVYVSVTFDTEYADWNADIYIQHDGSINMASEQTTVVVADDGTVDFPMSGLSTVTVIMTPSDYANTEGVESGVATTAADYDEQSYSRGSSGIIAVSAVVVLLIAVGVVLVLRRRSSS